MAIAQQVHTTKTILGYLFIHVSRARRTSHIKSRIIRVDVVYVPGIYYMSRIRGESVL